MTKRKSLREIEEAMVELYTPMFIPIFKSLEESQNEVKKLIEQCKEDAIADGTNNLPENFGDLIIRGYKFGDPKSKKLVEKARNEGAKDEDIKKWWNLYDIERKMMIAVDNIFRSASFYKMEDEGFSPEGAAKEVRKFFPMYGNPEDTSILTGNDRLIPNELRDRVNIYIRKNRPTEIRKKLADYTSFNAFIRAEIKNGNL